MIKNIKINNQIFSYTLRKSKRAKRIRISASFDRGIVAILPHRISQRFLEKFLKENFVWLKKQTDNFDAVDKTKLIKTGVNDFLRKKRDVHTLLKKKISEFNKYYNFDFGRICVRNQKTRWGSCSSKKNLNFSYKLFYLSDALVDYIVVHELCHLQEMNHSKNFWNLVAKCVPDHKLRRRELREAERLFV